MLGTSVTLLTQRDAQLLARSVSSLQILSNNRFILGIAGGFIREAMENHGSDFNARWDIVKSRLSQMKADWMHANSFLFKLSSASNFYRVEFFPGATSGCRICRWVDAPKTNI